MSDDAALRRRTNNARGDDITMMMMIENEKPKSRLERTYTLGKHYEGKTITIGADIKLFLRMITLLILLTQIVLVAYIISIGRYDLTYYTYWNYLIVTIFYILLFVALWAEKWLLTFLVLFLWPMVIGSTLLVMVAILIIIKQNPSLLLADMGENDNIGTIHTGDFLVHVLPSLEMLILLLSGWYFYVRAILGHSLEMLNGNWRAVYLIYWVLIPLVPMGIYSCIWSVSVKYPTGIATYILWIVLFLICFVGMFWLFFVFTVDANVDINSRTFWGSADASSTVQQSSLESDSGAVFPDSSNFMSIVPLKSPLNGAEGTPALRGDVESTVYTTDLIGSQLKNRISLASPSTVPILHHLSDATNFNSPGAVSSPTTLLKSIGVMRSPVLTELTRQTK